ncbi:N-acetylmuramoyl-L-alanine amidase [Intrasporangium calvum]|uniref:Cell wall hydrolase/autolysin n=1 Tax=Intrasporangium calvum (strain ATCC 23552 / DSM 43043 / JCM 3097 / NBRC 12989 / NCIMB 10167 / NRRL B-3866 / 7 KIP) TaxID=710696 RepID=E6S7E9_INTC7|nr:N-acetylmuramoyl-L-alanine amidase [Intrasporangium calvum]ADU50112.1 cell wall hydrolase/autolysin [Intrasporangium calvum DSM 43043]AXG14926.1 cell wall hydrolase [Intrasporangium calvum]
MSPQSVVVLRRGDSGPAVADVCARLLLTGDLPASWAERGVPRGTAVFDETVEEAVKSFQQRRGLLVDGVVGRSTYSVLDGARWALGDRVLRYVPDYFLEGDDVVRLQARLLELGFTPGKVDGIHGPATDAALRSFQAAVGLTPDGTLGPETLRAFQALQRSVTGGSANALREREQIRRGGFSLTGRTVVLDPGHGGADPGAVGHGLVEADLSLDLARRIEGRLTAHGVEVVFTRTGTTAGEEIDRAAFANSLEADLVLSIHTDHSEAAAAHGAATFFYGHGDPSRRTQGAWSTIGEHFAELLLREVVARTGLTDCRSHPRSWPLLRRTRMPAVRLEVGYLSHPSDAATLADPLTRDRIAEGVVVALQRLYLGDADTARTGMLKLADLRRHIESARDGHPDHPQPGVTHPGATHPGASA